jgi:hypothetical protein
MRPAFHVRTVMDSAAMTARLWETFADLVILDINMPAEDGHPGSAGCASTAMSASSC